MTVITRINILFLMLLSFTVAYSQDTQSSIKLARVKYSGGGDWYNDPSAEVNLLKFVKKATNINVSPVYEYVDLASDNLFIYPLIFITGHGNMNLTDQEAKRLRAYLENGGFLYVDDDYGLDQFVRKEMKKVFPDRDFTELPFDHGIYKSHFNFPGGFPKIHEHDDKASQTFGIFFNKRLCVLYTFETNPSDGWADPEVHNDTPEKREESLKIGTNIIVWALSN
jgi:hypothetical protein